MKLIYYLFLYLLYRRILLLYSFTNKEVLHSLTLQDLYYFWVFSSAWKIKDNKKIMKLQISLPPLEISSDFALSSALFSLVTVWTSKQHVERTLWKAKFLDVGTIFHLEFMKENSLAQVTIAELFQKLSASKTNPSLINFHFSTVLP